MASPPTQPQAARESEQYLRTYKSTGLLFILGSTRITRHQEWGRNAWWASVGLDVPAAPRLMTWGQGNLFFVGIFWFLKPPRVFPSLTGPRYERWVLNWRICLVFGIPGNLVLGPLGVLGAVLAPGGWAAQSEGWDGGGCARPGMRSCLAWAGASTAAGSPNLPVGCSTDAVAVPEHTDYGQAVGFAGWTGDSLGSQGFNSASQLWVAILIW